MIAKPKPTFCYHGEEEIRQSGLLSPERMAEVSTTIDARIEPCFDAKGVKIANAFIAECPEGRMLFARADDDSSRAYLRRSVLAGVLTEAELELVNKRASGARASVQDAERFAKAKKVEAWDGGAWLGDRYFSSMDELCDHLESDGEEWPVYVWAAEGQVVIPGLGVDDVVEHYVCDRGWEDMSIDDLHGVAELQAALDKFVEVNKGVESFNPDYSTAILLAPWKAA